MARRDPLEAALEELRAAPPEAFTRRRSEQVRALRRAGHADAAAELARRRKPSAALWAANALGREAPREVRALLEAGERLEKAQQHVLAGSGGAGLRDANRALHEALEAALDRARALLEHAGGRMSPATLERVRATLLAAATGAEAQRRALREGALEFELSPAGLGSASGFHPVRGKPKKAAPARQRDGDREEARRALHDAERLYERLEAESDEAEKRARDARHAAERAQRALKAARDKLHGPRLPHG